MTNIDLLNKIKYFKDKNQYLIKEKGGLEARYYIFDKRPKWFFWLHFRNKYEVLNNLQMQIRAIQGFIDENNRQLRFLHRLKDGTTDESTTDNYWKQRH